ncbi:MULTISPECIES: head-tail connector protein [unclassified Sphingobium]|uniref:head-tail connector protein n=1 Tax=unclassified Sphingobium TaxID=2611147 RepID=UPI002224E8F2|nr:MULTISPECIES: phage head-tail connector protein [unclassified Sphingobium]MCW2393692.1 putative phiE125 gp8 family phage protein [Sphingobium sp. B8D3B]MCW2417205.1 putative phiE125 gp8 family phage protein [Sphingobium sp. B8D3C]
MSVIIEKGGPLAVPLEDLKQYLGVSLADDDAALTDLLRAASEAAEQYLGQMLIERAVTEVRGASGAWGRLTMAPVSATSSIEGLPADGAAFVLPVTAYTIDIDAQGAGWVRILNPGSAGRVRVTYRAGLALATDNVPDALQHAVVRLAGEWYARRDGLEGDLPASVVSLLRPWRRVHLA